MIDFFFAILAAGINSADVGSDKNDIAALPTPLEDSGEASIAAQSEVAEVETAPAALTPPTAPGPSSPTVNLGSNVITGSSSVVIGGASLLDGTEEEIESPAAAQVAAIEQAAPAPAGAAPAPAAPIATVPAASAPATNQFNMAVVPPGLVAEPQIPSGKFTTAIEVKPILNATKGNWVAVREYDGKDYVYVTHIWGWRCGLHAMAISLNGEPMQNWPLPPCHTEFSTPNAVLEDDGVPALILRPGSVQQIEIQIVYDDLTMDAASFERGSVLIP